VQRLQHVAVAAERHHAVRAVGLGIAVDGGKPPGRLAGFGRVRREEGDRAELHAGFIAQFSPR
jgi:hypothetical protein